MIIYVRVIAASALGLTLLLLPVAAEQPTKIDFSSETVSGQRRTATCIFRITQ
jgi:hypothetical protein